MPIFHTHDAEISYGTAGESGSPVLLIMGFGVPGSMWQPQVRAMESHHRVAWFDNVGGGSSRHRRRRPPTTASMADHATEVMTHLGWDRAHVVGVSMGGMIAQELALRHRSRVLSLSLLVTHAGGVRAGLPKPRAVGLFVKGFMGRKSHRARHLQELIFTKEYLLTMDRDRMTRAMRERVTEAAPLSARLGQLSAVARHRSAHRLHQLAGLPTLVVKAARDQLIHPNQSDRLHNLIPGSRLVEFDDAGHGLMLQCAPRLNQMLLDHFSQVDVQSPAD